MVVWGLFVFLNQTNYTSPACSEDTQLPMSVLPRSYILQKLERGSKYLIQYSCNHSLQIITPPNIGRLTQYCRKLPTGEGSLT